MLVVLFKNVFLGQRNKIEKKIKDFYLIKFANNLLSRKSIFNLYILYLINLK